MNIRLLREKANLSQQDLSDKTGIPKSRIAKWEQGKGNPKSGDNETLSNFFEEYIPQKSVSEEVSHFDDAKSTKPTDPSMLAIVNLTETNLSIARSNEELVAMLKKKTTADVDPDIQKDVFANILGLREFLIEAVAEWKKTSVEDVTAALGTKLVAARKKVDKMSIPAGGGR